MKSRLLKISLIVVVSLLFLAILLWFLLGTSSLSDKLWVILVVILVAFGIDSRWSFGAALIALVSVPLLQVFPSWFVTPNGMAVMAYFLLCAGVLTEIRISAGWPVPLSPKVRKSIFENVQSMSSIVVIGVKDFDKQLQSEATKPQVNNSSQKSKQPINKRRI